MRRAKRLDLIPTISSPNGQIAARGYPHNVLATILAAYGRRLSTRGAPDPPSRTTNNAKVLALKSEVARMLQHELTEIVCTPHSMQVNAPDALFQILPRSTKQPRVWV
jgi:hypothetical protein